MDKIQKLQGMSQDFVAHQNPVTRIPKYQQLHPKQETLIDRVLRSIIQQKLTGRLINKQRKQRKQRYLEGQIKSRINLSAHINLGSVNSTSRYKKLSNQNLSPRTSFAIQMHEKTLFKSSQAIALKKQNIRKARNLSSLAYRSQPNDQIQINPQIPQQSFISAVQIENSKSRSRKQSEHINVIASASKKKGKNVEKLPLLPNIKSNKKNNTQINAKNNPSILKSFFKKPADELVSKQIWNVLSNKQLYGLKKKKRRNSAMMSQILGITANKSTVKGQVLPQVSQQFSSKDQIYTFIDNLPIGLKMICKAAFSFFQVSFPHQCSMRNYANILEELKNAHKRGWSAMGFIFWDVGKNGSIRLNDIFLRFRQFEGITDKQQNQQQNNKSHQKLKYAITQLDNIIEAKRILDGFIKKLSRQLKEGKDENLQKNISMEDQSKIKYLQEAFLIKRTKKIIYKDIEPLFNAGKPQKNSDKSTQIQLVPKDLGVKLSSAYSQSFLATQHNQQTRQIRQLIQKSKNNLQKMKKQRNSEIQTNIKNENPIKKLKNYEDFVKQDYGGIMRNIVLLTLGSL